MKELRGCFMILGSAVFRGTSATAILIQHAAPLLAVLYAVWSGEEHYGA
jgi:hypothetical protein